MDYKIIQATESDNKGIIELLRKYSNEFGFGKVEDRADIMNCPNYYEERNGIFFVIKDENGDIIMICLSSGNRI